MLKNDNWKDKPVLIKKKHKKKKKKKLIQHMAAHYVSMSSLCVYAMVRVGISSVLQTEKGLYFNLTF